MEALVKEYQERIISSTETYTKEVLKAEESLKEAAEGHRLETLRITEENRDLEAQIKSVRSTVHLLEG